MKNALLKPSPSIIQQYDCVTAIGNHRYMLHHRYFCYNLHGMPYIVSM